MSVRNILRIKELRKTNSFKDTSKTVIQELYVI